MIHMNHDQLGIFSDSMIIITALSLTIQTHKGWRSASEGCLASSSLYGQQWWPAPKWCRGEAPFSEWPYWVGGTVPPETSLLL